MPATDRYSLLVETQERGAEAWRAVQEGVRKTGQVVDQFNQTAAKARETAVNVGLAIGAITLAMDAAKKAIGAGTGALVEHASAGDKLVDTYRAVRLAVASTQGVVSALETGAVLSLGIIAERIIAVSNAQSKLVQSQVFQSFQRRTSLSEVATFANLDRMVGESISPAFTKRGMGVTEVADAVKQLQLTEDPISRIQLGVRLFGDEAEKILPKLNQRFLDNVNAAQDLALVLDTKTQQSILRLRDTFDSLGRTFEGSLDLYRQFKAEASQGIVIKVAALRDSIESSLQQGTPGPEGSRFIVGPEGTVTLVPALPGPPSARDIIRSRSDLVREAQRDLSGQTDIGSAALASNPLISRADAIVAASKLTEDGLKKELASAEARFDTYRKLYQASKDSDINKSLLAPTLFETEALVRKLSGQVKALEEAKKAAENAARVIEIVSGIGAKTPGEQASANRLRTLGELDRLKVTPELRGIADLLLTANVDSAPRDFDRLTLGSSPARLRRLLSLGFNDNGLFVSSEAERAGAAPNGLGQAFAFAEGAQARRVRDQQRAIDASRQLGEFEARRLELIAGPGGEVAALERGVQLRLQAVDAAVQLGAQIDAQGEKTRILQDRELQLLEIRKRQNEEFKNSVQNAFDALVTRGGGGLLDFARAQGLGIVRSVVGNAASIFASSGQGRFTLPGQRDDAGNPTIFGRLLANTPFANVDPIRIATDRNTEATNANTAAYLKFMAAGTGGLTGAGTIGSIASIFPRGIGSDPFALSAVRPNVLPGYSGTPADDAVSRAISEQLGFSTPVSASGSNLGQYIGLAAAGAGGAFGVMSGIKQGGARGGLTAASSAAGAASAILALSGVAGPAAPILAAVGLGLAGATYLFGDPRKKRDKGLANLISDAAYTAPDPLAYNADLYGRSVDYDFKGGIRSGPVIVVNQNINAIDQKGVIENADKLAAGIQFAIQQGHPLANSMRESVLGGNTY